MADIFVIKRDGTRQLFDRSKIVDAITKAFDACCPEDIDNNFISALVDEVPVWNDIAVEEIQDNIIEVLRDYSQDKVADSYQAYRSEQSRFREIVNKVEYQDNYVYSDENAATSSATDPNANVTSKNVATLESEDRKVENRGIQRYRMKRGLKAMYPELASQYLKDIENNIIYPHDEASTSVLKQYCMAASLYPLMLEGVGNIDGVTPGPPNDIQSFSGQVTNLDFLLSSQCKGAVAFGGYFIAYNYYVIAEFGDDWYNHLDDVVTTNVSRIKRTVKDSIIKGFKQFVWGINQPAGNRSYQSPFTNISYYDRTYFYALFGEFYYPDGTRPQWEAIDALQRMFMKWFNQVRLKQILTFPVETLAMVYDPETNDIIDQDYKNLCAEMYAEGHSFFTYISDSADSLASCCRLRNKLSKNTFNPTSGLTGIKTGSCNVITLNINHIVQDWYQMMEKLNPGWDKERAVQSEADLREYLIEILDRVYKYHIVYKTMLYEWEERGVFASSNGGYINIRNLYSTIGINGHNEAARFLGLKVSNNPKYIRFLQVILGTIKEQNEKHSIHDNKRPFIFNSECVPAESLGAKNYNRDKAMGYWVPEDENLYNSYFYNAHDNTSVLDKFILHGKQVSSYCDGGSACHVNLDNHLSKKQYLKLINFAIQQGTNYFTFNVPNSKCEDCGYITKHPLVKCPKCESENITQYTRVIGYLRPITAFSKDRQIEASQRVYSNGKAEIQC